MTHKLGQNFSRVLPIWVAACLIITTTLMFWGGFHLQNASAAALASTNVEPATLVAGDTGTATVTFTTTTTIVADGKIKVTFPSGFNVSGANGGTCTTMDGTFVTSIASQVVTLTRQNDGTGQTAAVETCTIGGIVNPLYSGSTGTYTIETTNASDVQADIDAAVSADAILSTDAAASIVVATPTVGGVGDVTVTLTTNLATDANDTINITFPTYMNISGVASAVTGTLENGGEITCADAGSQVVTCTVISGSPLLTSSTIIMTGITSSTVGTTDVTVFEITDEGVSGNDIAIDTAVALTDITAAVMTSTNVQPSTTVVGQTQTNTISFTTINSIASTGKIVITYPSGFNVAGANAATCSSMDGSFATAVASQVVTITRSGGTTETAAAETCTIAGIINPILAGSAGTYSIVTTTSADLNVDGDTAVAADSFSAASSSGGESSSSSSSTTDSSTDTSDGTTDSSTDTSDDTVALEEGESDTSSYTVGTSTSISVVSVSHTVTVSEASEEEVTVTIESDPITVTIASGEYEDIDTDDDGVDDMRVTYEGLDVDGAPELTIMALEMDLSCTMPSGDGITTVEAGDFIKSDGFSAVYYVTADCGRRVFMDERSYFTWQDNYDDLVDVTDETLSALSLEGVMLPKTGVVLVKVQSDAKVYALGEGSTYSPDLQWVTSEDIAIDLFGDDWADYVIDIEPTFFSKFGEGADIESADDYSGDTSKMKKREDLS